MSDVTVEQVIERAKGIFPGADEIWFRADVNDWYRKTPRSKAGKWHDESRSYYKLEVRRWGRKLSYPDVLFVKTEYTLPALLAKLEEVK